MLINIVTVSSGWILQKIAERISINNTDKTTTIKVSHTIDKNADVNYYVDLQNCYKGQKTKCDIGYMTHAHENSPKILSQMFKKQGCFGLNGIINMNRRYEEMVISIGYPQNRTTTIVPGETYKTFPFKKTVIGIVSRGGYPGYGQQFMEQMLSKYDFSNFILRFLGNGWNKLEPIAKARNFKIALTGDADYSVYPKFYHTIDYLLIPTLWTAGPMSMQEALSCGVPIIASDVGFVNYEFKADYVYKAGDVAGLSKILNQIIAPKLARRKQVENMRWSKYTQDVIGFAKKIKSM